ncbi:MAG: sugar-binding protein [Lachnospiraceae bacterium]|nr:sugar-binding protein [Lachnospiraceae bacterium]
MPTQSLERWNRDGSFLKEQFESAGYEVSLTYADNKIDQQVKDIEGLIADNVNLLVVAAVDGEALSQVLGQAKEQNIPVISYDRLIMNTDSISYYVSFDNYTVGKLQGEFVRDKLDLDNAGDKTYNIEFTAGDPADNNAGFFFNGAFDVLKPYIDKGTLVVPSGQTSFDQVATAQWDTATAMERFQNILGSYYSDGTQLDVALCSNDSTALGVAQAIESDYAGSNTVIVTGQDGDEANLANIVDGKQTMTVYKAVANEAVATLDLGVAILNGEKPDASLIDKAGWSFDCAYDTSSYDNGTGIIPSYLLVPTVVTKENMQTELVDTGYYTMDDKGYLHPVG